MKTAPIRAQRTRQVQSLAILAMFTAVIFLLTFTPLGLIDLPVIKATVLHVPVIIGSILLGPRKGAFLGGMFGLASLMKNTLVPNRYPSIRTTNRFCVSKQRRLRIFRRRLYFHETPVVCIETS